MKVSNLLVFAHRDWARPRRSISIDTLFMLEAAAMIEDRSAAWFIDGYRPGERTA